MYFAQPNIHQDRKHTPVSPSCDEWDVPFLPELNPIPEEGEDPTSNIPDEEPSFGIPLNAQQYDTANVEFSPSLNEFMPPSNSSLTEGGSSEFYKRHDSFRSVNSDPPLGPGSVADVSSSADRYENFNSPISDAISTVTKVASGATITSPSPIPANQCMTFRPDRAPSQIVSEGVTSVTSQPQPRPRTPPQIAKLNFSFLEPPSPIPIRSTIALCSLSPPAQPPKAVEKEVAVLIDKQGLEDFLSVIGEKQLWSELEDVENEFSLLAVPPSIQELLGRVDTKKEVSLSCLCQGVDDEQIFGDTVGNLAYLNAWEINEKRCSRYSGKLNTSLCRYSFDRLSYQVDLWTLNGEDRQTILDRISRMVKVRKRIAKRASERQWNKDFCGTQLSKDTIKMTLIYVKLYHKCLTEYQSALVALRDDLNESKNFLDTEIRQEELRDEIISRWKDTLNYYTDARQDMVKRGDWLAARLAEWKQQAMQLQKDVAAQQLVFKKEQQKLERIKQLSLNLNIYRDKCLLIDEWALSKVKLDPTQHIVKLTFPTTPSVSCVNPSLLLDAALTFDENHEVANKQAAELRKDLIARTYGEGMPVIDALLAMISPWELELRLKASPLPFVKGLRIGNRDLVWNTVYDKLKADNEGASQANATEMDETQGAPKLFCIILTLLGAAVNDMLTTTFKELRQSASIDDLGGISACLLNNAERLAVEVLTLWHEFSAFNSHALEFREPLATESTSTILKFFFFRNSAGPKLVARIPVAAKSRIDVLTARFDIFAAIQGGGLQAGFESVDSLSAEQLANVRLELKRKGKDICYECSVSVSHDVSVILSRRRCPITVQCLTYYHDSSHF